MSSSLWGGATDAVCVLDAFAESSAARRTTTAIVDDETELTYGELAQWVGELMRVLDDSGIRPGDRVAVTGPRDGAVVAALLAIVGVGATYVPLDPEYPQRRLAHMLSDSDSALLLYSGPKPEFAAGAPLLEIPLPRASGGSGTAGRAMAGCHSERPVYVIYTSGSTGWPKGVALPHRSVDNMVTWQMGHSPRPDLRTSQFAPLNFDVSFQEILGTLCGGGSLVMVPESLRRDPFAFLTWLGDQRIERLFLPYLALQMLAVVAAEEDSLDRLRLVEVNVAGEQLVCTSAIREFFARIPGCRLVNHYGQSESAMVTSYILEQPSSSWPSRPPLGTPLPGCELLVDPAAPADPDVGELLVAGLPMSLGYLGRPELNARRFVPVEPTPHGNTRAFRTGDLVRRAGDVVHFLGRTDHDVKVRGVRVNLLEVEAWLLDRPEVAEAACVLVEIGENVRGLRAAVTLRPGAGDVSAEAMLASLTDVLPSAAIPQSITMLDDLPRTPSGKVDRDALVRRLETERV